MYVPPLFPEPETVDLNVADDAYDVRLQFIRRVVHVHAFSIALIALLAIFVRISVPVSSAAVVTIAALIALSAVRRLAKGSVLEPTFSLLLFPLVALGASAVFQSSATLRAIGVGILAGNLAALLYLYCCRRDFSFLGQFTLSGGAASLLLGTGFWLDHASAGQVGIAIAGAWAYLAYYTYDLASLLQRRRRHEIVEAALDLYRDLLNFVTYGFRVWHHWRTIRI